MNGVKKLTNGMRNPVIDEYISKEKKWQAEFEKLRSITLDCGLTEELKWRLPCYTLERKNIVIIQGFKEYCALMFFKGALLRDPQGILTKPGENSQTQRQMRFTTVQEIEKVETTIKEYIDEAIKVEQAGLKVTTKETSDYEIPEELLAKFNEIPDLKQAFESLTPGRQRAYLLFFSKAKQSKTRVARIEKYIQPILEGKGLHD